MRSKQTKHSRSLAEGLGGGEGEHRSTAGCCSRTLQLTPSLPPLPPGAGCAGRLEGWTSARGCRRRRRGGCCCSTCSAAVHARLWGRCGRRQHTDYCWDKSMVEGWQPTRCFVIACSCPPCLCMGRHVRMHARCHAHTPWIHACMQAGARSLSEKNTACKVRTLGCVIHNHCYWLTCNAASAARPASAAGTAAEGGGAMNRYTNGLSSAGWDPELKPWPSRSLPPPK